MDRGAWQATVHGVAKSQTWHVIPQGKRGSLEKESTGNWTHQGGLPGGGGLKGVRLGWRRRIREEGILGRHRA